MELEVLKAYSNLLVFLLCSVSISWAIIASSVFAYWIATVWDPSAQPALLGD
jgi:hypothetical protein